MMTNLIVQPNKTGRTQKHSLITSSYKIKTYWNIFYKYGTEDMTEDTLTADTINQEVFNFPASSQRHYYHFQQDGTCQTDGLATMDKMTRCSASGPRDHRT
jgi:hypothetical protein